MRTMIDRAGRVVVPKAIREGLGLRPGQELVIEETGTGLLITPVVDEPEVAETPDGPVIVPRGKGSGDVVLTDDDVRTLLEAGRR